MCRAFATRGRTQINDVQQPRDGVIIVTASDLPPRRLKGGVTARVSGTRRRTLRGGGQTQGVHAGVTAPRDFGPIICDAPRAGFVYGQTVSGFYIYIYI